MKRIIIYIFLFVFTSCANRVRMGVGATGLEIQLNSKTPEELYKKWLYSYEEDKDDGTKTFRSTNFKFPLSRHRLGFEFFENGKFIEYTNGPDDRPVKYEGKWIYGASTKTIDITFEKFEMTPLPSTVEEKAPYTLNIISIDKDVFKLKMTTPESHTQKDKK